MHILIAKAEVQVAEEALKTAKENLKAAQKAFAAEFRKRRQGHLSLRECAKKLGVTAPFLSDVELGRRNPNDAILNFLRIDMYKNAEDSIRRKNWDWRENKVKIRRGQRWKKKDSGNVCLVVDVRADHIKVQQPNKRKNHHIIRRDYSCFGIRYENNSR